MFDNNKLGEIRPNQLITTFGPGSIVDAVKDSVTVLDLNYWKEKGKKIKQMSMSSGYSSSAIRERIYFGDDMSGVLLYTGSADKEGSLGGLVELGNIDQLIVLMKDAFQEALVCTNDPECLNNVPAGNNSNGAACHSCCMISETACENGNRMLDRGLIVPIDGRENQSYFKTLVEELCQLEV